MGSSHHSSSGGTKSSQPPTAHEMLRRDVPIEKYERPLRSGLSPWQLKRVIEFVDSQLERPIRIADLAATISVSESHFTRSFSISAGVTPYQFIMKARIERAQTLMRQSKAEMADIAIECGLSDQPHFNRLFRRFVGTTPLKWRTLNPFPELHA
ncbi:helix-turn-helix domain-containing protein [Pararhizobium arenae]|uniref:helix-turn-helix domain-containing protein n=1 Tax=Pararhizobium arenae TaxID=1856850 RepID=UPI0009F9EB68|nr:AraC family transcriptional regulator [Pararhizobium arenae]